MTEPEAYQVLGISPGADKKDIKKTAEGGADVYFVASMLEFSDRTAAVKEGEALFPAGVRQHRLYVKNQAGQELGYVSFGDDRLYYVIIPLFEQKNVQVRISVAKKRAVKSRRAAARYENLNLWLRLIRADTSRLMRRVIVNSTPLIVLCKIGKVDILQKLYGGIVIPQAVFHEVTAKEDSVYRQISEKDWIHVEYISDQSDKKMYKAKLHDGEVEVMILAQENPEADLVIIDDNAAKKTAKYLDLTVTGTIGASPFPLHALR